MRSSVEPLGPVATGSMSKVKGLRWWIAALLMGITIINYLDRSALAVAAPTLKAELHIDAVTFSHILMAFQLTYLVMQSFAGRLIDWLNIRIGFAVSLTWWSVAQMLTGFAGGWVSLAIFRGVLGIGEAGNFPGAIKTVAQWFPPKERTIATGIINIGSGMGALAAPPLVAFLILRFNWRIAFVITGLLGLFWVVVWLAFYRAPEDHPRLSPEELAHIRGEQGSAALEEQPQEQERGVWRVVLPQKNFWALALARFLSEPAWQFFTYWIPLYLSSERHLDLKQIAYFAWVPFLAADLGSLFGGLLSPFFINRGLSVLTARKAAATVPAVLMIFAIFIGQAPTAPWAILFFSIGAFAHQALSSTLLTLPADLFPKRTVATANGMSGTFGYLGGMLFTLIVGRVAESVGYAPLFVGIAFFDLVGAMILWVVLREPEQADGGGPRAALEVAR
jgi:ACS family hexuronate transporter-like MFS transporter